MTCTLPLAIIDELEGLAIVLVAKERDDFLERVARRRAHAKLIALDLNLALLLKGLNVLVDASCRILVDAVDDGSAHPN